MKNLPLVLGLTVHLPTQSSGFQLHWNTCCGTHIFLIDTAVSKGSMKLSKNSYMLQQSSRSLCENPKYQNNIHKQVVCSASGDSMTKT